MNVAFTFQEGTMYLLWSRGTETLSFPMDIDQTANADGRRKRADHSHTMQGMQKNDGTVMVQLLRADKLEIPEKYENRI